MLNLMYDTVAKIVFSGINGKSLILPLIVLMWVMRGQAKDFIYVSKEVMREGEREKDLSSWS